MEESKEGKTDRRNSRRVVENNKGKNRSKKKSGKEMTRREVQGKKGRQKI
jgi:hypothetical protein